MHRTTTLLLAACLGMNAAAQCPDSTAILFSSDFESGDGGLVPSGYPDWEHGIIGTQLLDSSCTSTFNNTIGAHSGQLGWGTVLRDCYANSGDTSVLGLTVDLSDPAYTGAELRFWHWWEVFTNFDFTFIRVNGQQVYLNNSQQFSQVWLQQTIDLSPFLGLSTVDITFHLFATTVVNKAGWYLDDMEVTACLPGTSTSLEERDAPGLWTWPNPAEGSLQVRSAEPGVQAWRLLDLSGREVRSGSFPGPGTWTLITEGLTGPHLLEVSTDGHTWRRRVILR
ncbi:MAG TPA: hypothetical protein PLH93_07815 [Flavobacteriales bacterium]|jgi:hypothetical protein|nr:hypothetical protein [Flavobacteriales bacterium]HQW87075.1 hypothetical protein [Flavobacteriales bacterium]